MACWTHRSAVLGLDTTRDDGGEDPDNNATLDCTSGTAREFLEDTPFATLIESGLPLATEREMTWTGGDAR